MNGSGGQAQFHGPALEAAGFTVAYDPAAVSPAQVAKLVRRAVALCAQVEGLTGELPVAPEIMARLLRDARLRLHAELVDIGAIAPCPEDVR